ncbi:hypothetical protein [Tenacibaculum geojense]|uniref:Uncharacterized protein n=1 Tax=Tenacibaculum geojense TaxID=915352 RepID=A0ABW3JS06_9FLAO
MIQETFRVAINEKLMVRVTFISKNKGILTKFCIPFDIGPSRRFKDKSQRYHFFAIDNKLGNHNLSILPNQILNIEVTTSTFNPANYISWKPCWFIKRNWGIYS